MSAFRATRWQVSGVAVLVAGVFGAAGLIVAGDALGDPAGPVGAVQPAPSSSPSAPSEQAQQTPSTVVTPASCPTDVALPDPARPTVSLRFELAADRSSVTGVEYVRFTPDQSIDELVFRLWPNSPLPAHAGAAMTVSTVTVNGHKATPEVGSDRTLMTVPLGRVSHAGTAVSAVVHFQLTLPPAGQDRYGRTESVAWWGSGHPLLAWVRGEGWQRDPAPLFHAESAVSEAAQTDVTVVAPAGDQVATIGPVHEVALPTGAAPGMRAWRAESSVARDVSVAVGKMVVQDSVVTGVTLAPGVSESPNAGVQVRVAIAEGAVRSGQVAGPAALANLTAQSAEVVHRLSTYLGVFPYASLSLVALPGIADSGIEYPGAILLGNQNWHDVVPHEIAHQWFYGMVGDNQARDPWLDEGFATFLESLYNRSPEFAFSVDTVDVPVGGSVSDYGTEFSYASGVYARGGGALIMSRGRSGPESFDMALRCYVRAEAWSVATPADVEKAWEQLPATIELLQHVRAIP